MKNKWLYTITGLFIALFCIFSKAKATDKIAVVNVFSIFQQSSQRTIVAKQLENEFKDRALELQIMEDDLNTTIKRLERDGSTMNSSERSVLERSLITQRETFSDKAQSFEQDNRRRQTEERNKILKNIQDIVKSIASKEGYDVVIDTNAVAYAKPSKDITDEVLKQVN